MNIPDALLEDLEDAVIKCSMPCPNDCWAPDPCSACIYRDENLFDRAERIIGYIRTQRSIDAHPV